MKRNRKFGFRARMATRGGPLVTCYAEEQRAAKSSLFVTRKTSINFLNGMETGLLKTGRFTRDEHIKRPADIQKAF